MADELGDDQPMQGVEETGDGDQKMEEEPLQEGAESAEGAGTDGNQDENPGEALEENDKEQNDDQKDDQKWEKDGEEGEAWNDDQKDDKDDQWKDDDKWKSDDKGWGNKWDDDEGDKVTETVMYDISSAGRIIGHRGQNIKDIRWKTGAEVQVDKEEEGTKVTLTGTAEQVEKAKKKVQEYSEGFGGGDDTVDDADKVTEDELFELDVAGKIIGRGGENVKNIRWQSGCDVKVEKDETNTRVTYKGTPEQIEEAKKLVEEFAHPPEPATETLFLEMDVAGKIIGKGGAGIKNIRYVSGAELKVEREEGGTRIEFSGKPSQIEYAKKMVHEAANDSKEGRDRDRDQPAGPDRFAKKELDEMQKALIRDAKEKGEGVIGRYCGYVKNFDRDKGFGFLQCDELKELGDVYVHKRHAELDKWDKSVALSFTAYLHQGKLQGREITAPAWYEGKPMGGLDVDGCAPLPTTGTTRSWRENPHNDKYEDCEVMEVSHELAKKCIGKAGAMVKQIREDSGSNVHLDLDSDPCTIKVQGTYEQVDRARTMVYDILNAHEPNPGDWTSEEYIQVGQKDSRAVIGPKASHVTYIEEATWAKVEVGKDTANVLVRISGTFKQVDDACQMCFDAIHDKLDWSRQRWKKPRDSNDEYRGNNRDRNDRGGRGRDDWNDRGRGRDRDDRGRGRDDWNRGGGDKRGRDDKWGRDSWNDRGDKWGRDNRDSWGGGGWDSDKRQKRDDWKSDKRQDDWKSDKRQDWNKDKDNEEKKDSAQEGDAPAEEGAAPAAPAEEKKPKEKKEKKPKGPKCMFCGGPHKAADCPTQK